jgi:hypothetical protein
VEAIHRLRLLVPDPGFRCLAIHPRDQEPHCEFPGNISTLEAFTDFAPQQLEEIDDIFNSPNPRKASLVKKKVATDLHGNILEVEKI